VSEFLEASKPPLTKEVEEHIMGKKPEPKQEPKGKDYSMPADAAHFAGKLGEI
jgi:hypothetical protein